VAADSGTDAAIDPDALLERAEAAVARALARGAAGAEAFVASGTFVGADVERDRVTYTTGGSDSGMGLRVVRDGRLGFAFASDPARVDEAVDRALALSRLAPARRFAFAPGGRPYPDVRGLHDPRLASIEPPEVVAMAGELVDSAKAVDGEAIVVGGGVGVGWGASAIANSEGVSAHNAGTSMQAAAYVVLRAGGTSTGFESLASRLRDVDAAVVGRAAAQMAKDAQGPAALGAGGEMDVVLRPTAAAELLEYTVAPSLIGDAAQRGESAFTGKAGEAVAGADVSLSDDPTLHGGLNSGRSDDEGVPSRRNVLIGSGVLRGFLYDAFSAHEYGVEGTGSAVRGAGGGGGWKSQPEAFVSNLVVDVPSRGSLEDLVSQVDRGLLVHDVLGAHTANASTLDFSVNSTMPFEIRKGEIVGVRGPVMLAGNVGALLRSVLGGGGEPRQCGGTMSASCIIVPWVAAGGVVVTP
jgi:PmbA protein